MTKEMEILKKELEKELLYGGLTENAIWQRDKYYDNAECGAETAFGIVLNKLIPEAIAKAKS